MDKLRQLIEPIFEEDFERVAASAKFADLESWDSLNYVKLVLAVQTGYGVELSPAEIRTITSLPALVGVLKAKGIEP